MRLTCGTYSGYDSPGGSGEKRVCQQIAPADSLSPGDALEAACQQTSNYFKFKRNSGAGVAKQRGLHDETTKVAAEKETATAKPE